MRLAVSNIAWTRPQDDEIAGVLRSAGATAVELAPTAVWGDPWRTSKAERREVREAWEARGLPVVALQSLLFGLGHLQVFEASSRPELSDRLTGMMELAADLGAHALVFGSPKNRLRGGRTMSQAIDDAAPFFAQMGAAAARLGVHLCIEPNPPQYGCDFVTTAAEGRSLVERVGSPGFALHLDAAGMYLAGDDLAAEISRSIAVLRHFHFSAPNLGAVDSRSPVGYAAAARALRAGGYRGNASIEMRQAALPQDNAAQVRAAVALVRPLVE